MARLFQLLETVAPTNSTILITGETGTGKEVVARAIHHNSPRRMHRFVALNCSAIPETLLEAELFGHVRGAFTGAVGNRQGRLEQAHKGTLFLDEVGTMSAALQMKLLRVLQEREFERVGDSHTIEGGRARHRRDQQRSGADGRRRAVPRGSVLPAERDPGAAAAAARAQGRHPAAGAALPREVRAAAARATALDGVAGSDAPADGVSVAGQRPPARERHRAGGRASAPADRRSTSAICRPKCSRRRSRRSPSAVTLPEDGIDLDAFIADIERDLIQRSLERTGGNKGQAARLLNLKRTTLVEKLKRLSRHRMSRYAATIRVLDHPDRRQADGVSRPRAQELLPTLTQLKRTNQDVAMKWFARGKLWESPEAERAAERRPAFTGEKRGADWRPGGAHKDPRDRFKKKHRPERAWSPGDQPVRRDRPWSAKPPGPGNRGTQNPLATHKPWESKPSGPRKPWTQSARGEGKPWSPKPPGERKPWSSNAARREKAVEPSRRARETVEFQTARREKTVELQAAGRAETVEFEAIGREKTLEFQASGRAETVESETTWRQKAVGRSAFRRRQTLGRQSGGTAKAVGCETVRATQTVA